ncbi:MAG: hypothetical protein J6J21_01810, partial [Clostridia bacterium]|nr:hypothetical protein [Clostridia bacterium]
MKTSSFLRLFAATVERKELFVHDARQRTNPCCFRNRRDYTTPSLFLQEFFSKKSLVYQILKEERHLRVHRIFSVGPFFVGSVG